MAFDAYWEWLEIPPDRRPPDFYALLGLAPFESDPANIRSAGLTRTAHVRRFCLGPHGAKATQLLGELANAFSCLEDPARKQTYDESLRAAQPPSEAASSAIDGAVGRGALRGFRSVRLAARRRDRRRAADRTLAWLVAGCAVLAAAIAVAAREMNASLDATDSVASQAADSVARPQNEQPGEPRPAEPASRPIDESAPGALPGPKQPRPINEPPDSRPADEAPGPDSTPSVDSEAPPFFAAPGREQRQEFPQNVAQAPPPAASKEGEMRADAEPNPADDPSAEAGESLEKLKRLQQEQAAEEKLRSGVAALSERDYEAAIGDFAAAIEECEYRDNEITSLAARRLDDALRSYKAAGNGRSEMVREAQGVLKEFRNRIKRSQRRPAGKR